MAADRARDGHGLEASVFLASGRELKLISGVDDHSRFCVIAKVVARATGRAVCQAFIEAMASYGVPDEVLTDNGKQFTARFGRGSGEVLFDRICRKNGIAHRLTKPRSPTTTGKIERWHQSIQDELLAETGCFETVVDAQAAVDAWRELYNQDPIRAWTWPSPATASPLGLPMTLCRCGCRPSSRSSIGPSRSCPHHPRRRRMAQDRWPRMR
jgi:hypothetical protein